MALIHFDKSRSSVAVLLALVSLSGCDKLPGFAKDEQARADAETQPSEPPATPASSPVVEPADSSPAPSNAESGSGAVEQPPTPEPSTPEQPPAAVTSELDDLLVRVSGLADPKHATESTVEQDTKTAWDHYKAKRWPEAAQFFARVAARDPGWKHAHNLACASAKAGKLDDARIALAESFKRGGDAAKTSANKDGDLAAVRNLPWFTELLAESSSPKPLDDSASGTELDDDELDAIPPPNCPPGVTIDDEHYCWHDTLAEWKFEEVVFSTPVTLDLEVPTRPKDRRWKQARGKIPWKELRAELGIQHTIESDFISAMPHLMEWSVNVWTDLVDAEDDTMPYFWWPEDNTPILVLPNKQKIGSRRFMGVILARKTDAGWRAVNLVVTKDEQFEGSTNAVFESGVVLRFDGLELFTLTQYVYRAEYAGGKRDIDEGSRYLCRIRWEQGKLARACAERWQETGKSFG